MAKLHPVPEPALGPLDGAGLVAGIAHRLRYSVAKDGYTASDYNLYQALAYAVRDRLIERWFATQDAYYRADAKRVYYLSLEFLMGRALVHNTLALGAQDALAQALGELGCHLEDLQDREWDAGLGNGGLGRLAACMLDSAATLGLPFYGYGIRYEFGIFQQRIQDGFQVEAPDNWLRYGNPWEIARPEALFPVSFYGRTQHVPDGQGGYRAEWVDTEEVWAMAYDTPVAGFGNGTVNTLRLWSAKSSREFDLGRFNAGEYVRAVEDKTKSENISKVLYPPDDQYAGKELRLKQQYFFVAATLQDVLRRFHKREGRSWEDLPDKVQVQLNDTHPALAIAELMRVLVDREHLGWDRAWQLTRQVFAYTNHTVLPEALERWPLELLQRLLPRHAEIVLEIDRRWRADVGRRHPQGEGAVERTAIVGDGSVRMAHLAIVGSHSVNGVAKLHSEILTRSTFADFHQLFPERFNNKTNGITPRRFLLQCNPKLSALITEAVGQGWPTELERLAGLRRLAEDAAFGERWALAKRENKRMLSQLARTALGLDLDPDFLFDVQVKRMHEYKRQLLNVLHALALYHRIRDGEETLPRAVIVAGKAAPGYAMAKLIIKLVHAVAALVQADPQVRKRLQVVFLPNYSVSLAERIFPACELSEQISTAGTEASGTGNMKAALNGALTIGTLDGANVEIQDAVGAENIFIFGHTADQIEGLRRSGFDARAAIEAQPELKRVLATLQGLSPGLFDPILDTLFNHDRYFHAADFPAYLAAQREAAEVYARPAEWTRRSILNVAGMGRFSCDRTVDQYAREIWGASTCPPRAVGSTD